MTWGYIVWRAAPLFLIIMLVSYFGGDGWRAIPSALVAWGTILLAFATFTLIRHSREQEEQRRKDELVKEKCDREERWLNEIIDWAIDVRASARGKDMTLALFKGKDLVSALYLSLNPKRSRSSYIEKIASKLDRDLQDAVKNASTELKTCLDSLLNCLEAPKGKPINFDEPAGHAANLENFAEKVIEEATKIKTEKIGKEEENMSKEGEATGSNEPTLKDIEKHLKDIKHSSRIADNKWNIGFGVTAMVIAYSWLTDNLNENDFSGIVIGVLGILLVIYPGYSWLFSSLWRKWRSKREQ